MSGEKGTRYEDLFAVTLIAEQAYRLNGLCDGVNLEAQAPMYFVDDLVVREDGNTIEQCFQLKNSPNIIWGRGKKSITDDFERQLVISKAAGLPPPKIALVTSDAKCSASLQATIPASLSGAAEVRWFPWAETTNLLCYTWPETMKAIAWLSKHESPNAQELSEVLTILLGVWAARGGNARISDLIADARCPSPMLIRLFVPDKELEDRLNGDFKNALAAIDNFSYSIFKGFFKWKCSFRNGSFVCGVFAQDCQSKSFNRFQDQIAKHQPATFEELEEYLP